MAYDKFQHSHDILNRQSKDEQATEQTAIGEQLDKFRQAVQVTAMNWARTNFSIEQKRIKDRDDEVYLHEAETAINAHIVSVLEELDFILDLRKRMYTDGGSHHDVAVPIKEIHELINKGIDEFRKEKQHDSDK